MTGLTATTRMIAAAGAAALLGAASLAQIGVPRATAGQAAFFETKVRPILFENCFACHGEKDQKGGLRLDSRNALLKGGGRGPTIGGSEKSLLLEAISHTGSLRMPPGRKLTATEITVLAEWVTMGAPWPDTAVAGAGASNGRSSVVTEKHRRFWSFQPPRTPVVPAVKDRAWVTNPIDAFVLARLESSGLKPAPPADRRSLIRRAYFDLIGLPPTPEEVDAFASDPAPLAWEKVIDRLLASPRYGERWGRHWLDLARYADSNGLDENKAFGHAWRYRDYVIAALNKDKPYDRFLTEQLAGDLMPAANPEERNELITATGFLVLGPKVLAEQDKPKLVMDIVDEQVEVTSKAFMGLTVACARCHDHKFDPFPTSDYYALAGIFKSTKTMKDLGFVSNWNERSLASAEHEALVRDHQGRVKSAEMKLAGARSAANEEVTAMIVRDAEKLLRAGWELSRQPGVVTLAEAPAGPGDRRVFVEAENFNRGNLNKDFSTYGKGIGVIHNVGLPNIAEWDITVPADGLYQVELRYASAESRPVNLLLNGKVVRQGCAGAVTGSFQPEGQRWEVAGRFTLAAGKNTLSIESAAHAIPHFDKLMVAPAPPTPTGAPPKSADEIARAHGVSVEITKRFASHLLTVKSEAEALALASQAAEAKGPFGVPEKPETLYSPAAAAAVKMAEEAVKAEQSRAPAPPTAMAVEEGRVENCKIHVRGDTEKLGPEVSRGFLTVLSRTPSPEITADRSGRLDLARWMAHPSHPLTGRVAVNRVWQAHFGEGLVRTPDNWGFLGERPSHPELLDWLATAFVAADAGRPTTLGWSFKKLHKLIMLSSTYRMSTANPRFSARASVVDPDNRLLWRMSRRRLEAEPFRDAMLAVAGNLDDTMGGTLLRSPNNEYVTNDQSGNAAQYGAARRSIYLPIIRNALFDMFQAFDLGDPSIPNAKRPTTTIAPQALWVMNSPFALEQSRAFAAHLLKRVKDAGTPIEDARWRLALAYRTAFGRPPRQAEVVRDEAFLSRYALRLEPTEADAGKRRERSWEALCHTLFASNEFIFVN